MTSYYFYLTSLSDALLISLDLSISCPLPFSLSLRQSVRPAFSMARPEQPSEWRSAAVSEDFKHSWTSSLEHMWPRPKASPN